jgi:uncharacterized coiled-coil DUF342 family protein
MNEDFTELIKYLDEKFTRIDQRFDEMKKDFVNLQTSVDAYAKKADTYFQEMVMLSPQSRSPRKMDKANCRKTGN